ncbi:hypothetical protein Moror_15216 [Moniliophthora roreri MCA 2997]|uniref:Uncharacterized protein n=1 Tax=Moniliophthora roreri (strain MCA 2997) TaxID=1381753 RepID=V2X1S9_MONRO|nr:hypothetical protein Moror_15216 [Moniliophthora roreri MCA 2997]
MSISSSAATILNTSVPNTQDAGTITSMRISKTLTSVVSFLVVVMAILYTAAFLWMYRCSREHSRPLNKKSGKMLQQYAPYVYMFIVFNALAELGTSAWLLTQYRLFQNYPNEHTYTSVKLLLFSNCWTVLVDGAYTLLFLHPSWSGHPVSSVGAQLIWVTMTWVFYVAGAALLNHALPLLFLRGICTSVVYCSQLQALFALTVIQILVLTGGGVTLVWLAWQSIKGSH